MNRRTQARAMPGGPGAANGRGTTVYTTDGQGRNMAHFSDSQAGLQPDVQPDRPNEATPPDEAETARCSRCGWIGAAAGRCPRCQAWLARNLGNFRHGLRSMQLHGPVAGAAAVRCQQIREALIADHADLSTARGLIVSRLAEVATLAESAWAQLEQVGPVTAAGRRRPVVDLYLQAADRVQRLAAALGLDRQPIDITDCSAAEWLDRQAASTPPPGQAGASGPNDTPDGSDIVGE